MTDDSWDSTTFVLTPGSRQLVELAMAAWLPLQSDGYQMRWRKGTATATYSITPRTDFEVIVFTGPDPVDIPDDLPLMGLRQVLDQIRAADPLAALAGLQAAEALASADLALPVCERLADPDPLVAEQAGAALFAIGVSALGDPSVSTGRAVFSLPGWRREKLQLLRRFTNTAEFDAAFMADGVEAALQDADWEIRATAMLAAGRLRLASLAGVVAHVPLPQHRREGVSEHDARVLLALRAAVGAHLDGTDAPRVPAAIRGAVRGDSSALGPAEMMLVRALTMPIELDQTSAPDRACIRSEDGALFFADDHPVVWVPPGTYVLGDPVAGETPHSYRLDSGFFIDARWRGSTDGPGAIAASETLAARYGCAVDLPSSDQLEMAARGEDGRRFPWGMNAAREVWADLSPLGVTDLVAKTGEWLAGAVEASGGGKASACAQRRWADPAESLGYRFVYG